MLDAMAARSQTPQRPRRQWIAQGIDGVPSLRRRLLRWRCRTRFRAASRAADADPTNNQEHRGEDGEFVAREKRPAPRQGGDGARHRPAGQGRADHLARRFGQGGRDAVGLRQQQGGGQRQTELLQATPQLLPAALQPAA